MKKSFLMLGMITSVCVTCVSAFGDEVSDKLRKVSGYCQKYSCKDEKCVPMIPRDTMDTEKVACYTPSGDYCGEAIITTQFRDDDSFMKTDREKPRTRARSATMMVPQKVVYKEITFDDSVDEFEE